MVADVSVDRVVSCLKRFGSRSAEGDCPPLGCPCYVRVRLVHTVPTECGRRDNEMVGVTARARWLRRMAEGLARRKRGRAVAWTCTPSEGLPGETVKDGCGKRHRTRETAARCARSWTRRRRRPVPGLRRGGRNAILPAVPVRIDHDSWRRLPPAAHAAPEPEATNETADALAVIARRTRQRRTCWECGHVRDGALAGQCPACGAPVPGSGVDP